MKLAFFVLTASICINAVASSELPSQLRHIRCYDKNPPIGSIERFADFTFKPDPIYDSYFLVNVKRVKQKSCCQIPYSEGNTLGGVYKFDDEKQTITSDSNGRNQIDFTINLKTNECTVTKIPKSDLNGFIE